MARRRKSSGDSSASLDSLLDTMTNVVGILVIVLVVTQLGVRDAVDRITKDVSEDDVKAAKAEIASAEKASKESERQHAALLSQVRLLSQDRDDKQLAKELEVLEGQLRWKRDDLNKILAKRESEKAAHQKQVDEARKIAEKFRKQQEELNAHVVAAQEKEASLRAMLDKTPMRKVLPTKVVNLPNPRKAPEGATAMYIICRDGKLYPWDREKIRTEARKRAEWLVTTGKVEVNPKTGIDPKRMIPLFDKFRLNDNWFLLKLKANGRQPRLVFERKRNAGYDISDIENPRGPYVRILKSIDPKKHYLRFVVWTDSYDVYLVARRIAGENGLLAGWDISSSAGEPELPLGGKILFGPEPPPMPDKPKPDPPKPPARPVPTDTID